MWCGCEGEGSSERAGEEAALPCAAPALPPPPPASPFLPPCTPQGQPPLRPSRLAFPALCLPPSLPPSPGHLCTYHPPLGRHPSTQLLCADKAAAGEYATPDSLCDDLLLVASNAERFNKPGTPREGGGCWWLLCGGAAVVVACASACACACAIAIGLYCVSAMNGAWHHRLNLLACSSSLLSSQSFD